MVRRTKFRALGGSRMYNKAIRGRQNGNPGLMGREGEELPHPLVPEVPGVIYVQEISHPLCPTQRLGEVDSSVGGRVREQLVDTSMKRFLTGLSVKVRDSGILKIAAANQPPPWNAQPDRRETAFHFPPDLVERIRALSE